MKENRFEMSDTSQDCLRAAFAALLRGDTAERDRQVARAEVLLKAEQYADAVTRILAVDFYVGRDSVAIPTKCMAKAAGAIH